MKKLIRSKFREWLTSHPKRGCVGQRRQTLQCPIAQHLCDIDDYRSLYCVTQSTIKCSHNSAKTPEWAKMFIKQIDQSSHHSNITARCALAILDNIPL